MKKPVTLVMVAVCLAVTSTLPLPSSKAQHDSLRDDAIIAPTDWDSLKSITLSDDDCGPKAKPADCPGNLPKPDTTEEAFTKARHIVVASECYNASNVSKVTAAYKPCYPVIAAAAHASGKVDVLVVVDESGAVTWARAVNGNPLLQSAAAHAACKWRFQPDVCAGKKRVVNRIIPFDFGAPK
jgi:TonB family protein